MPLIRDKALSDDEWVSIGEEDPLPTDGSPAIVGLKCWRDRGEAIRSHNGPLGIRLDSDEAPDEIAEDLGRFDLVALNFPNFNDGRPFSHARLLRERYGFKGEIRATGDVLQDQLFFMLRCGFDAFELREDKNVDSAIKAFGDYTVAYQPGSDHIPAAYKARLKS